MLPSIIPSREKHHHQTSSAFSINQFINDYHITFPTMISNVDTETLGQFLQKKMQAPPIEKKIGRNNDIYINEKKKRIKVDIFSKSLGTSASITVKCAIPWNSVVF